MTILRNTSSQSSCFQDLIIEHSPRPRDSRRMFDYQGIRIAWLGHDGFKIKNGKTIVIDPFKVRQSPDKADILLISHEHFDHLSIEDIKKVVSDKTTIVTVESCKTELCKVKAKEIKLVRPGDKIQVGDVNIEAVPAYNKNKFREPGKVFHPREDGKVGYIITMKGVRVYHAGDTDPIPEMTEFKADIALLPVSGTYVMTSEEAAEATKMIKPRLAIPMHYGAIVGSEGDAERFNQLASCPVRILKPE